MPKPQIIDLANKKIEDAAQAILDYSGTEIDETYFKSPQGIKDFQEITELNSIFTNQIWDKYIELVEELEQIEFDEYVDSGQKDFDERVDAAMKGE